MLACPKCGTERIHFSRRKGIVEKRILSAIQVRPYRCESCDFRFFRWSIFVNSNSLQTVSGRLSRWLHFEEHVNAGGRHKA